MTDLEFAVETMELKGRKIIDEAIEVHQPIAVFAAFSGGNDSVVSTDFGCENFGATAVHANTGIGIERTRVHARELCRRKGWPLKEVHAPNEPMPDTIDEADMPEGKWIQGETAFETYVLNFGFPGPAQHNRMFDRLKGRCFAQVLREAKAGHQFRDCILMISGIRHDESSVRAGYKRAIQKQNSIIWVNPFYHCTRIDFECYRQWHGLPRNPVSDQVGISGECLCGAYAKKGELARIADACPVSHAYLLNLQERVRARGFPWGWEDEPPQWYLDSKKGYRFLFEMEDSQTFLPACVGCVRQRMSA